MSDAESKEPSISEWFAIIDGAKSGPHTLEGLAEKLRVGAMKPEAVVWRDGMDNWKAVSEVLPASRLNTWYVLRGSAEEGQYSTSEVRSLHDSGKLSLDTPIRASDSPHWGLLRQHMALLSASSEQIESASSSAPVSGGSPSEPADTVIEATTIATGPSIPAKPEKIDRLQASDNAPASPSTKKRYMLVAATCALGIVLVVGLAQFRAGTAKEIAESKNAMETLGWALRFHADDTRGERFPPPSSVVGRLDLELDSAHIDRAVQTFSNQGASGHEARRAAVNKALADRQFIYLGFTIQNDNDSERLADAYTGRAKTGGVSMDEDIVEGNLKLYRLREGIERFFITDINNPAASAQSQATLPVLIQRRGAWSTSVGINVLFLDGHVELVKPGTFPNTDRFWAAIKRMEGEAPTTSTSSTPSNATDAIPNSYGLWAVSGKDLRKLEPAGTKMAFVPTVSSLIFFDNRLELLDTQAAKSPLTKAHFLEEEIERIHSEKDGPIIDQIRVLLNKWTDTDEPVKVAFQAIAGQPQMGAHRTRRGLCAWRLCLGFERHGAFLARHGRLSKQCEFRSCCRQNIPHHGTNSKHGRVLGIHVPKHGSFRARGRQTPEWTKCLQDRVCAREYAARDSGTTEHIRCHQGGRTRKVVRGSLSYDFARRSI
ncbi:MAG: DUF4339 domain-containing protein [Candidatus Competibacteraceae bacterium]|nr:DUF4339 domain-containing protein [Candidatus Competibacteraceae bacterium]